MKHTREELLALFDTVVSLDDNPDLADQSLLWAAANDPTEEEYMDYVLSLLEGDEADSPSKNKGIEMPNPKDFKDEEEFMPVCVAKRQEENPDEDADQSTAVCMSMWEDSQVEDPEDAKLAKALAAARDLLKYSDDQPRAADGKFGSGDGGGGKKPPKDGKEPKSPKEPRKVNGGEIEFLTHDMNLPRDLVNEFIQEIGRNATMQDIVDHANDLGILEPEELDRYYEEFGKPPKPRSGGKKSLEEILARAKKVLGQ